MEDWDAAASTAESTEGGDTASASTSRRGLFAVVRCQDVALLGERGTKVPNASIEQLSLEIEVAMTLNLEYNRCSWLILLALLGLPHATIAGRV